MQRCVLLATILEESSVCLSTVKPIVAEETRVDFEALVGAIQFPKRKYTRKTPLSSKLSTRIVVCRAQIDPCPPSRYGT